MKSHISKKCLLILDVSGQRYLWFGLNGTQNPKPEKMFQLKASVYVNQLYFHFVEDPGDAVAKMDVCVCLCVCVSQSCKSYNPRSETAFIMLFWLNVDCECLFCLFQAGFVMFCGLGSPLDWPGSSLILCVLFQFSSSQNPQSTRFCHEIRVAIPEMQSTKPEMHMKWYEMSYVKSLGEPVHNKQPYVKLGAGWHRINGQTQVWHFIVEGSLKV